MINEQKAKLAIIRGIDLASVKNDDSKICPLCARLIRSDRSYKGYQHGIKQNQ